MEKFSAVMMRGRSGPLRTTARWIERWVCSVRLKQKVVGNRRLHDGSFVSQAMYHSGDKLAHVCPFVRDSLDRDLLWLEWQPDLTDSVEIEELLWKQADNFVAQTPAWDPQALGRPAAMPELFKAYFTIFTGILHFSRGQPLPLFDQIHVKLKPQMIARGLMLGQFYTGCPTPGIHGGTEFHPLYSPYPSFALRYLDAHDFDFLDQNSKEQVNAFRSYFPIP